MKLASSLPLWAAFALAGCATPAEPPKGNDKITTNDAIDLAAGALVRQGSLEGDLASGRATPIGRIGDGGHALWGLAIEP